MAKIVGIHGIAQQFGGAYQLGTVWYDGIRDGLDRAGHQPTARALAPGDVRVAFFGDLFRPRGALSAGEPQYTDDSVKPGREEDLLERWYEAAAEQDSSLRPPPGALGGGRLAVQAMLSRLLKSRTFAEVAQNAFIGNLKQVTAFLGDPRVKQQVMQRVGEQVTLDTRIVIGHSLGSVAAYEYLARFAPPHVELLVTLGSPLGIPNLIFERLTPSPARGVGSWPGQVGRWVNVADADDVVALRKLLAPLFPAPNGAAGIEDHPVDNGDQPHAVNRYLGAEPTGAALGRVL
jgi:hypothetical protein